MFTVGMIPLAVYQSGRTQIAKLVATVLVFVQLMISMGYNLRNDTGLYFFNSNETVLLNDVYTKT